MFSWDPQKAITNFEKHGVSFEETATIFSDAEGLDCEDLAHATRETRYKRLGTSIDWKVLLVIYTVSPDPKKNDPAASRQAWTLHGFATQ